MHGLILGAGFYVLILLFGIFCVRSFYVVQTSDREIVSMGVDYLTVICVFGFGQMFQLIFEKILQSTGRTSYTMVMQIVGAVINIILDPIFIFGYFGLPAMGTIGATIATVAGQIIAMLLEFQRLLCNPCPALCVLALTNFFWIFQQLRQQYLEHILNYRHLCIWQFLD